MYYNGTMPSDLMEIAVDTACEKFTLPYLLGIEHPTRISTQVNIADGATMIKPRDIVGSSIKELAFCSQYSMRRLRPIDFPVAKVGSSAWRWSYEH
ncbi:hypothetical protein DXT89_14205, partial [Agrobacterium vitis]